jgi:hypothetical protein
MFGQIGTIFLLRRTEAAGRNGFRSGRLAGFVCMMFLPIFAQDSEPGEVAGGVRVPEINDEGVMTSLLTGREVRFRPRKPMEITGLEIFFFEPDGKTVRMNAVSPASSYDSIQGKVFSDEEIKISGDRFVITGTGYRYVAATQSLEIFEDVRVVFKNMMLGDLVPGAFEDTDGEAERDADLTSTP